jgi:hypothetical protein
MVKHERRTRESGEKKPRLTPQTIRLAPEDWETAKMVGELAGVDAGVVVRIIATKALRDVRRVMKEGGDWRDLVFPLHRPEE